MAQKENLSPVKIWGIKNCDSMKKAFVWLTANGVAYEFIDYRKAVPSEAQLADWSRRLGWQKLLNTRGTTWRGLDEAVRADIDENKALRLLACHPTLIRRPVIDGGDDLLLVGFDPERYALAFGRAGI